MLFVVRELLEQRVEARPAGGPLRVGQAQARQQDGEMGLGPAYGARGATGRAGVRRRVTTSSTPTRRMR